MKKKILMILAALCAIMSCENAVEDIEADNEPVFILNGLIDASSTSHLVHLSKGAGKNVNARYDAVVRCYVNGEFVSEGKLDAYGNVLSAPYRFEAVLKEGDVLRIETGDGIYAEAVVPETPVITKVDTTTFEPVKVEEEGIIKIRVTFNDIPDEESFYMADIESKKTISYMGYIEDEVNESSHYLQSDNDPLLNGGGSDGDGDSDSIFNDILENLFTGNEFNVFSDNTFANMHYTLRTKVPYSYLRDAAIYYRPYGYPYNYVYTESVARFKIFSIDKTTFRYIKSVSALSTFGSYIFTSPVILPCNVNGGIGYLGVMNPAVAQIDYPRKRIPVEEGIWM